MDHYEFKEDGKLHTRYSELKNCSKGSVERIVKDKIAGKPNFGSAITDFGTKRHSLFEKHLKKEKKLPDVFGLDLEISEKGIERSFAVEVWENVVIHFTPDLFGRDFVADFKTTGKGKVAYENDIQILFYAWLLSFLGFDVKKGYYLCEVWDKERTEVQDYQVLTNEISDRDKERVAIWAKGRVENLYNELKKYQDKE